MPKNCVLFELQAKGKPNYKEPHAANTASAKCGEKHQSEGVVCTTNMQTKLLASFFLSLFVKHIIQTCINKYRFFAPCLESINAGGEN
jgi:hypothetical protein